MSYALWIVNGNWEWWKFGLRVECISAFKIKNEKINIEKERKALQTGREIVSQKELIELECFRFYFGKMDFPTVWNTNTNIN